MNERFKERKARLSQLERELDLLRKKRRLLERDYRRDEAEDRAEERRIVAEKGERTRPPAEPAAGSGAEPVPGLPAEEEDRERFAHYFMTGSLGRGGPQLRRERRLMRNKAIVAALFAILLLVFAVRLIPSCSSSDRPVPDAVSTPPSGN